MEMKTREAPKKPRLCVLCSWHRRPTLRLTDPAPGTPDMEPRRDRGVRCIWFETLHFVFSSANASPRHHREHTPAQVFTRVSGVALGFRGQFGSNIFRELVVRIGFKPSAHGEPFGRLVSVPAVLVSQNHFNDVVAKVAERREKFWKHEKIGD